MSWDDRIFRARGFYVRHQYPRRGGRAFWRVRPLWGQAPPDVLRMGVEAGDAERRVDGERGTVEPRAWDLDIDGLRVSVHRLHGCDDGWFGSCHALGVERLSLTHERVEAAREQFLDYLDRRVKRWSEKITAARAALRAQGSGR